MDLTLLQDLHETSGATMTSIFGELPYAAMHPETFHIPFALRTIPAEKCYTDVDDLSSRSECILPYSRCLRTISSAAYDWSKKLNNVAQSSPSLLAMEQHKLFWYVPCKELMRDEDNKNVIYWTNDNSPNIDLGSIDMENGAFIKIVDRSDGGGTDVYYGKDKNEVKNILGMLQQQYVSSTEPYKKHIFVIEPAYITIKEYQGKDYNVTGRAFITLAFDTEMQTLSVKIAGAKWMFPIEHLQGNKTTNQMLSNVKHSIAMSKLSLEELNTLSKNIVECYGEVFKAAFEHDDLIQYCKGHLQLIIYVL